jgi:hypothetical protein
MLNESNSSRLSEITQSKATQLAQSIDLCMCEVFRAPEDAMRSASLLEIVLKAIDFNRVCQAQRSRYAFRMPSDIDNDSLSYYSEHRMDIIGGDLDMSTPRDGDTVLIASPCMIKAGELDQVSQSQPSMTSRRADTVMPQNFTSFYLVKYQVFI